MEISLRKVFKRYGMQMVLKSLLSWVREENGRSSERYLDILENDLTLALEHYMYRNYGNDNENEV